MVMKSSRGLPVRTAPGPPIMLRLPDVRSLRERRGDELIRVQLVSRDVRLEPAIGLEQLKRALVVLLHVQAQPLLLVVPRDQDRQREVEDLPRLLRSR